jgi:hypothetical protein
MTIFEHTPHPHIEARKHKGPTTHADTATKMGPGARIGVFITAIVGTMWCAAAFTLLALVSAPSAFKSGDTIIIVAWVAQTFLQLVLLPIIIVGQNIAAKASDARADMTYKDAEAVLHEAQQIQSHLAAQDKLLTGLAAKLLKGQQG